jgi:hypothetical protein
MMVVTASVTLGIFYTNQNEIIGTEVNLFFSSEEDNSQN